MNPKLKADIIAIFHLLLIFLSLVSLPLLFYISWWHKLVLLVTIPTFLSWIFFRGHCLLTKLENKHRKAQNPPQSYETGFIKHYLKKTFGINCSAITVVLILDSYTLTLFFLS